MLDKRQRERLYYELGGKPRPTPARIILKNINWEIVGGFILVLGFLGWALAQDNPRTVGIATLAFVLVGWVFSLCVHEFTHAATAVFAGDDSPSTQRYLSFNPLHYVNPVFSIVMPLAFILLGGIGLPGGAVYLRRDLVRSKWWQSAISLAAPASNLLLAVLIGLVFRTGVLDAHPALGGALAMLAFFETMAALLNLLPIPPLDGFGAIAYWLPEEIRNAASSIGIFSILFLFAILWYVPPVYQALQTGILNLLFAWGVDPFSFNLGVYNTFFWRH